MYGFGGDGSGRTGCITTGPFANYSNSLGPGYAVTNHCIDRKIDESFSALTTQSQVDICLAKKDWASAWACIEGNIHTGGHAGIGAQVGSHSPSAPSYAHIYTDGQRSFKPRRSTLLSSPYMVRQSMVGLASQG